MRKLFAEVAPSERQQREATAFSLHPALLDAALHAVATGAPAGGDGDSGPATRLPFSWSGVKLYAAGASALRVRLVRAGEDTLALSVADGEGRPVASVESLALRATPAGDLGATRDALFAVEWMAVGGDEGETVEVPDAVVVDCGSGATDVKGVLGGVSRVLEAVQSWLDDERSADGPLVVVTRGAVSVAGEGVDDPAGGGVWGLVRAAQAEHPGRFVLVDVDGEGAPQNVDGAGLEWAVDGEGLAGVWVAWARRGV